MTDSKQIDEMADAWAASYGLRRDESCDGVTSLYPLFTEAKRERTREVLGANFGNDLLDHSRAFKAKGASRASVLVSAPYERSLRRRVGGPAAVVKHVWQIAEELELRVRVGNPSDRIYVGDVSNPQLTLPIVWWNPAKFELPYAALAL